MGFVGKVWKVLVGIKDGLVLVFMLLFFVALFAILSVVCLLLSKHLGA